MGKKFSSAEASAVIQEHNKLLKTLGEVADLYDANVNYASKALYELSIDRVFNNIATQELLKGKTPAAKSKQLATLLVSLAKARESELPSVEAKTVLAQRENTIRANLESLKRESNGIKRLFSSKEARNAGEEAYEYLSDMLEGAYKERVKEIALESAKAEKIAQKEAEEIYKSDPLSLLEIVDKSCTKTLETIEKAGGKGVKEAEELLNQYRKISSKLDDVSAKKKNIEDKIKNAIGGIAREKAIDVLAGIPVDALNRGEAKFKLSLVKAAGYETIADIYNASEYALAAIKGVSLDSANAMKRSAFSMMKETIPTLKLRLSADERTNSSTELVISVCTLRKVKNVISKNRELLEEGEIGGKLADAAEKLAIAEDSLEWFFEPLHAKEAAREGYAFLSDLLKTDYERKVSEFAKETDAAAKINSQIAWDDFTENPIEYFSEIENVAPGAFGADGQVYGLPDEIAEGVKDEEIHETGLKCQLRRYQEWGVKYALHQKRVLLGDDMGLGKTVQAIATMVSLRNTGETHFAVVCPASVITNWSREIAKHSSLTPKLVHGPAREASLKDWIENGGVLITTYETTGAIKLDEKFKFSLLVADEAHYIKNPAAKRTAHVKELCNHAERLLFMTGTALENKVDEMLNIVSILQPDTAKKLENKAFLSTSEQFKDVAAAVYYRRKRGDVLTELPDKTEVDAWCETGLTERLIYEDAVLGKNFAAARRVSWNVGEEKKSCKAMKLREIVEEAESEGRRVVVFSYFLATIKMVCEMFGDRCMQPINGSVTPMRRQQIIDEFAKSPAGTVLPSQIQAGGTGLNIQSASVIVICEPQLKPSLETQAIARAYRMGQARNVLVYRLLCTDTIDERISELLENKQKIFDTFANDSKAAEKDADRDGVFENDSQKNDSLSNETFNKIIEEEIQRIKDSKKATASST